MERSNQFYAFRSVFRGVIAQILSLTKKTSDKKSPVKPKTLITSLSSGEDVALENKAARAIQLVYKKYKKKKLEKIQTPANLKVLRLLEALSPKIGDRVSLLNAVVLIDLPESTPGIGNS